MANTNSKFHRAKKVIDDEYYTRMVDIAHEFDHYKEQFKGKRIICPCDWDESFEETLVYDSVEHVDRKQCSLFESEKNDNIKNINIKKSKEKLLYNENLSDAKRKCGFISFLVQVADEWGIKSISASGYNPAEDKGANIYVTTY